MSPRLLRELTTDGLPVVPVGRWAGLVGVCRRGGIATGEARYSTLSDDGER